MCFEEETGAFQWQLLIAKREEDPYYDWPQCGMSSPVTVEGDLVYVVDNRGVVMCLDARGMSNGNDGPFREERTLRAASDPDEAGDQDADVIWTFDLTTGAGIWSHDAAHSSILIHGDYLYLNSGTGVDNTHKKIRTPDAPSLVVLDKRTGTLVARDREQIAPNIFHSTWSAPALARIKGRELVVFGGGNGIVYAFEPIAPRGTARQSTNAAPGALQTLKKVWQFDFDPGAPKTNVHQFNSNRREGPSNFYGMPVLDEGRVYVGGGGDLWWGKNEAWLKCIDASGAGDITATGLAWSYPLQKHVLSTPAVDRGLVFIADCGRTFHCVEAKTGQALWTHEIKGEVWASPLVADDKVYLGTRSGTFYIFRASKEKKVLSTIELKNPISATATAANGVLYVATMTELFAVAKTVPAKAARGD
jgi:outer membrane protein assembly factor BamB